MANWFERGDFVKLKGSQRIGMVLDTGERLTAQGREQYKVTVGYAMEEQTQFFHHYLERLILVRESSRLGPRTTVEGLNHGQDLGR